MNVYMCICACVCVYFLTYLGPAQLGHDGRLLCHRQIGRARAQDRDRAFRKSIGMIGCGLSDWGDRFQFFFGGGETTCSIYTCPPPPPPQKKRQNGAAPNVDVLEEDEEVVGDARGQPRKVPRALRLLRSPSTPM